MTALDVASDGPELQPLFYEYARGLRRRVTIDDFVEGLLQVWGVPPRFREATFGSFTMRPGLAEALRVAQTIADPDGAEAVGSADYRILSAIFTGRPGCGKTHIVAAILAARARSEVEFAWSRLPEGSNVETLDRALNPFRDRSRFVSVPRLLETMRRQIRSSADDEGDALPTLESAHVLVLDDLGVEKVTDWTVDKLTTLIGARYDEQLETIVTSNYSLEELADRGYDRIVSRLLEDGPHVRIKASDYRVQMRAAS